MFLLFRQAIHLIGQILPEVIVTQFYLGGNHPVVDCLQRPPNLKDGTNDAMAEVDGIHDNNRQHKKCDVK